MHQRHPDFWLGLGTLLLIAASAIVVLWQPFSKSRGPQDDFGFTLRPADHDGRMRIDWNPQSQAVKTAKGGTLAVNDGGSMESYPVEAKVLRDGGLDYVRKSGDVVLTLTLNGNNQRQRQQAFARRISPVQLAQAAPSEPAPRREQTRARRRGRR